jgi:hypothetical protein
VPVENVGPETHALSFSWVLENILTEILLVLPISSTCAACFPDIVFIGLITRITYVALQIMKLFINKFINCLVLYLEARVNSKEGKL